MYTYPHMVESISAHIWNISHLWSLQKKRQTVCKYVSYRYQDMCREWYCEKKDPISSWISSNFAIIDQNVISPDHISNFLDALVRWIWSCKGRWGTGDVFVFPQHLAPRCNFRRVTRVNEIFRICWESTRNWVVNICTASRGVRECYRRRQI